ncbi:hypothetical protein JRO89_XS06G0167700 [Xanthoceras sorbifolium]|uniref:glucan endo-1,3-beta-D-glucosidase n=1 Tax=Xanthoceras sorbifolium TaxID=99658 RepID=A0ABQ8HZ34_9ROSI|nr:hypothetical protein JRO89_XS06G0167700 [Xanthoceras sorbifolium]
MAKSKLTLFVILYFAVLYIVKAADQDNEPFVGVNIGTDVSNLLSPADLVSFLQVQKITHVRLYDADQDILKALAKTKIRVIISVPNNQLLAIGSSNTTAASWIGRNVVAYYPETLITAIAVGDEVLTTVPSSAPILLPAIESLYSALFLSRTGSPLMMNLYPYYVFMQNKGVVPLDNSLFKPLTPSKEMMLWFLYQKVGWPSKGDSKEPYATIDNADMYNSNLIKHVLDRGGTPFHPEITSNVYIYELFNEDLRKRGFLANDTTNKTYCIAMDGVDSKTLQVALDWACGPGRANCSEIQPGEACYQPNNVKNHASYAFDSYYQKEGRSSGSCDFKGVAMITTTDPSHGSCIFPGSKKISNKTKAIANTTQTSDAADR